MKNSSILDEIVAYKLDEVARAKKQVSQSDLENQASSQESVRGFTKALSEEILASQPAVIAEIKKASPSKGIIRENFNPKTHAVDYQSSGATCLSVLTDTKYFSGGNEYLIEAKLACDIPVIRKDFIIDSYQIAESRALGADCILLIASILDDNSLESLNNYAKTFDLDVLLEVHNEEELDRAMIISDCLIGINNRNLHTFETDLETSIKLAEKIPADRFVITESGIHTRADVQRMMEHNIFGFLVGESFMAAESPGEKLKEIMFGEYS